MSETAPDLLRHAADLARSSGFDVVLNEDDDEVFLWFASPWQQRPAVTASAVRVDGEWGLTLTVWHKEERMQVHGLAAAHHLAHRMTAAHTRYPPR